MKSLFPSVIDYLQEIIRIVLANFHKLTDIDIELSAQGEAIEALEATTARIEAKVDKILVILQGPEVTDFELFQGEDMPITGIQAGGNADFTIGFVPPNGAPLQTGPLVSPPASPLITIGPALLNPSPVRFNAAVDATYTLPTFIIEITGVNGAGTSIVADFVIPVSTAPPPQITDFTLDQDVAAPPAGVATPK